MSLNIKQIETDDPLYGQMIELRDEVLRRPLGRSIHNDDLSKDIPDVKLVAVEQGTVIGCLMLKEISPKTMKLRAMAVRQGLQGRGIGAMLVAEAERLSWQAGYEEIELHARVVALGFYQRLGYRVYSDEFPEVGIPHRLMKKQRHDVL